MQCSRTIQKIIAQQNTNTQMSVMTL